MQSICTSTPGSPIQCTHKLKKLGYNEYVPDVSFGSKAALLIQEPHKNARSETEKVMSKDAGREGQNFTRPCDVQITFLFHTWWFLAALMTYYGKRQHINALNELI